MRAALLFAVVALLASGASSAVVEPRQSVATAGGVRAQVSYVRAGDLYSRVRLRITRRGRVLYNRAVPRLDCGSKCPTWRPVLPPVVRSLDGDREPEVLLDQYTGGAHCCTYSLIYRFTERGYSRKKVAWGNQGYRLARLDRDRGVEFLSRDDRFSYVFTSYAGTFRPIRIFRLRQRGLVDVTRAFPALVARDAASLWREYLRVRRTDLDARGVLAAWLADKYLLGEEGDGWRRLEAALRRGELGRAGQGFGYPVGRAYLHKLRAVLKRYGYAT